MKLTTKLLALPIFISIIVPMVSLFFLKDLRQNYEELDKNHKIKVHSAYEVEINILEVEKYILDIINNNSLKKQIDFTNLEPYQTYKFYLNQIKNSSKDEQSKNNLKLLESLTNKFMNVSIELINLTNRQNILVEKVNDIVNQTIDYELDTNLEPNAKNKDLLSLYDELEINTFELIAAKRGYYESNNDFFKGRIKSSIEDYYEIKKQLKNMKLSENEISSLNIIDTAFIKLEKYIFEFITLTDRKEILIKQMSTLINNDIDSVLDNHIQASLAKENEESSNYFKEKINFFISLSVVIWIVLILVSLFLLNPVIKYIKNLTKTLKSGDYKDLNNIKKPNDELGFLTNVIQEQYNALIESKNELFFKKEQIEKTNKNLKKFINTQNNIVFLSTAEKITYANKKFFDFFGYKNLKEFYSINSSICELFINHDKFFFNKEKKDYWIESIKKIDTSKRVVSIIGIDLKPYIFSVSINNFDEESYIVSFTDISETILENIKLENKTLIDKLTKAYNREYFEQKINYFINKYQTNDSYLAIAMIDIDYFKKVNDEFGHDIGDEVLIQFVEIIKSNSRKEDILVRWGGEEFILIIKVPSNDALKKILEKMRVAIKENYFKKVGQKTCSIGATLYKENEDIYDTVKRADIAVYEAKNKGRDCIIIQ
ncbi:GGDEF domain-containing protein [Halarcobacter sp.]|uniref:GGDEF domain-containing protein n=1 Tax=Halarcobacter sp. TaxID=2321133 RepID=UPI0029F46FB0|nr:GGDEF domain-containing protein [Halarcobacter sp.]